MFKYLVSAACVLLFACLVSAFTLPTTPLTTRIYIGGSFATLNGTQFNNIAYYDVKAATMNALSNGTDGEVKVVSVDIYGNLYIGGSFTTVGTRKTGPVAVWNIFAKQWVDTGLTSSAFSAGSVVTALDTNCVSAPTSDSVTGLFPCDIYVGGNFQATLSGSTATNLMWYHYSKSTWTAFTAPSGNVTSVSVISKNEFQILDSSLVWVGGVFFDSTGKQYGFGIYDNSANTWTLVDGVSGVTDIYYNPNIFSTDNIFISASSFAQSSGCQGVCNYNHKTAAWSAQSTISTGTVNKVRYIKGLSATNVGSIFIGGNGLTGSTVQRRDGTGSFSAVGTNGPITTVLGMDICGILSQYSVTGCKSGSVAVGGQNFLQFYDANANQWKSLLSETGYVINSIYIKTSSAVTSTVSFALMAIVAFVCFLF